MRSQQDKDYIISNVSDPYNICNFVTQDELYELEDLFNNSNDKVYKSTGPITLTIKNYNIPIISRIIEKIHNIYPDCNIWSTQLFYVEKPHIIHNDDSRKRWPMLYKAFNIPITYTGPEDPYLCFFDQLYLDGPSKFFNDETDIKTWYNTIIYDYKDVYNKSNRQFPNNIKEEYLSHLRDNWLEFLSFNKACRWHPTDAIVFDCCRLHCASNFIKQNITSKLGLSIFTERTLY